MKLRSDGVVKARAFRVLSLAMVPSSIVRL